MRKMKDIAGRRVAGGSASAMRNTGLLLTALTVAVGTAAQEPPAPVRVAPVSIESMAPMTWVAGTVISRADARLAAEVEGRLLSVAEVGTRVAAGDEIARIEDTALVLRAAELAAEVERARARLAYLQGESERQEQLSERHLTAASTLAQTRSDARIAASELKVAESRLAQTQDQIERTRIRAPFAGKVVERLRNPGERVAVGEAVARIVDPDHLEVVARPPLDYLPFVSDGLYLPVQAGAVRGEGRVRTVVALGDEATHVFELRLDVPPGAYAAGQTVRLAIPVAGQREVLSVPRDALVLRGDGIAVFVVGEDMTARRVDVTTGIGNEERIEVLGDLTAGSQVIIRGNERLRPGQSVQVVEG